jgi:hypothetical protein
LDSSSRTEAQSFDNNQSPLVFCGMCGALNPATSYYCAACGTTLVDAFHGTEGLRVYERPDSASRLIEIVASGSELEIAEDANAPSDFVRVRLVSGKLGYIRLQDVESRVGAAPAPAATRWEQAADINSHAKGCVSSTAALGALALAVALGFLVIAVMVKSNTYDRGTYAIIFCFGVGPFFLLTVLLYIYSRSREERLAAESEEAELERNSEVQ